MHKRLMLAVFVGSLGGFVLGYDLGALSSATQSLRQYFALSAWAFGVTISSSVWGTVFGSTFAGRLANRIGRLQLIALCSVIYAFAAICCTLCSSSERPLMFISRILCGMAIGGLTVGCPLYLAEIASTNKRGRIVTLFQIQVGVGVIVAFSVSAVTVHASASAILWKWSLGFGALPAMVLFGAVQFLLWSEPRLGIASRKEDGPILLSPLGALLPGKPQLFRRENLRLILIATSVAIFNQLSGVNVVLLYMLDILASAGVNISESHRYTILVSCVGLATTALGLTLVDRLGRKPLLYLGSAGMALCLLSLGFAVPHHFPPLLYLSLLIVYSAFFAFSQGTVVWVYLSELFPPALRALGTGYGVSVHWIANAILISIFPRVQKASSVRSFYLFALMMVVQVGVIWTWYPETLGTVLGSLAAGKSGKG